MTRIEHCWKDFQASLREAMYLHSNSKHQGRIADELSYARKIINIMRDEMRRAGVAEPGYGIPSLAELEARVVEIEAIVIKSDGR